jgi:hypothetical protein
MLRRKVAAVIRTSARTAWVLALLAMTGALAGVSAAAAAAGPARPAVPAGSFTTAGALIDVAATSAGNAWAVGRSGSVCRPRPLIVHWTGAAWKRVASPRSGSGDLAGIAMTSARSGWAVGSTGLAAARTLILRWNGISWQQVPSPKPDGYLLDVAATSARSAWAVGETSQGKTLILRWNGTSWQQVRSPNPAGFDLLDGVAATSARNAWAVGLAGKRTLILHWNGAVWRRVPSPSPARGGSLFRVTATSARNAWATGQAGSLTSRTPGTLILRWNGTGWKRAASPVRGLSALGGVAATSARSAWAVGLSGPAQSVACGYAGDRPATTARAGSAVIILRWNGTSWMQLPAPGLPAGAGLIGVAATSRRSAWAVGLTGTLRTERTLIMHWNGRTWS